MNKYFISFVFNGSHGSGFGNCVLENVKEITSYDDIISVEKQLQLHENLPSLPVVISYRKVYDE